MIEGKDKLRAVVLLVLLGLALFGSFLLLRGDSQRGGKKSKKQGRRRG
jgi:hypothetical protein